MLIVYLQMLSIEVIASNNSKHYVVYITKSGLQFKSRYTRHKCSFYDRKYKLITTLLKTFGTQKVGIRILILTGKLYNRQKIVIV